MCCYTRQEELRLSQDLEIKMIAGDDPDGPPSKVCYMKRAGRSKREDVIKELSEARKLENTLPGPVIEEVPHNKERRWGLSRARSLQELEREQGLAFGC